MDKRDRTGDSECRRFFLGVDGGGTKTTALVADESGSWTAQVVGGTINYCAAGLRRARENMRDILRQIADKTGTTHLASVFIGMSALYTRATDRELADFCDGVFDAERIAMDSDLFIALLATGETGAAAVGICGTGSMAAGRTPDGAIRTKGGYGYLLGDEGSGYRIALDGIRAAVLGADGAAQKTLLTEAALRFWNVPDTHAFIDIFYDPPLERDALAAFAPSVTRAALDGDAVADAIEREQASLFAGTARALLHELPDGLPFYVYGGVFQHDAVFMRHFRESLPETRVCPLPMTPVEGALRAARRQYEREVRR